MPDNEGRPVVEILAELYKKLDPVAEKYAAEMKVSCRKGCAHCCYLFATATLPEGLLIAQKLLSSADWKEWLPKLKAASLEHCFVGVNKVTYFRKGLPCVFLGEGNLCQIYAERPAACRYHYVVSPPENCSHHAPENTRTGTLDTLAVEAEVWELSTALDKKLGFPVPICGPIPLIVLYSMEMATRNDPEVYPIVRRACEGVPNPMAWLAHYGEHLLAEGNDVGERISFEDARKLIGL